jgi:hypothetical protein
MEDMRKLTLRLTLRDDGRVCKRVDGRLRIWPDQATARKELFALMALREGDPPCRSDRRSPDAGNGSKRQGGL